MISLNLVQEQYAQMSDEALQVFAVNEADKLTIESFHLLKQEFEKRNLDLGILNEAEVDKALSDLGKTSAFQQIAAEEYAASVWQFALDEKEAGKTNFEIYNSLLNKGLENEYAFMLVQSLDTKSRALKEDFETEIIVGWITFFGGLLSMYLALNESIPGHFLLYGFFVLAGGAVYLYRSYNKKAKYERISKNIEDETEQFRQN